MNGWELVLSLVLNVTSVVGFVAIARAIIRAVRRKRRSTPAGRKFNRASRPTAGRRYRVTAAQKAAQDRVRFR